MTELVQRSADFVRSALLEHLRFESHVEARALAQQPRGQQWRVIRVFGDMLCGFLEFGEGNRHGGSLRSRVGRRRWKKTNLCPADAVTQLSGHDESGSSARVSPPRTPGQPSWLLERSRS